MEGSPEEEEEAGCCWEASWSQLGILKMNSWGQGVRAGAASQEGGSVSRGRGATDGLAWAGRTGRAGEWRPPPCTGSGSLRALPTPWPSGRSAAKLLGRPTKCPAALSSSAILRQLLGAVISHFLEASLPLLAGVRGMVWGQMTAFVFVGHRKGQRCVTFH